MFEFLQSIVNAIRSFFGMGDGETAVSPSPQPPQPTPDPPKVEEPAEEEAAMSLPSSGSDFESAPASQNSVRVHNKFGFHTGPGGNRSGIGNWFQTLDAAGVPLMIKSVDDYGPLFEVSQLAKQSGVDHLLVFRLSTAGHGHRYDYDVPPYKDPKYVNDPEGGAVKHWEETKKKLPPEFDKERTWIEPINEVDKNLCDWLGRFGVKIANLAHAEGYKVSLFAWSSGEPEREGWEQPGMLDYLRLCAERPNQAAVALHEYSYIVTDIMDGAPYKIGRFQMLFDVCDDHRIPRPTVHITEWGWTLDNVPAPEQAMADMKRVAQLYNKFPEIKGAAIWYLGPSFGGIADKAQRLIAPLTQRHMELSTIEDLSVPAAIDPVLNETSTVEGGGMPDRGIPDPGRPGFVDPPADGGATDKPREETRKPELEPQPEPEPVPEPEIVGEPNGRFLADITIPDDTVLPFGQKFMKSWRVENTGNVAWGQGYGLVHVDGEAMGAVGKRPLPPTEVGETAVISIDFTVPARAGTHFSDWRFQDPDGNLFGDILFVRIVAEPAAASGVSNSAYVADVTIPDDVEIAAGQQLVKTWRVKNTGTRAWNSDFSLDFVKGVPMTADLSHPLPDVQPNETVEISVTLTAPTEKGTVFCDWRMKDDAGEFFGDILFMRIVVI